jgi:hypothetical protein
MIIRFLVVVFALLVAMTASLVFLLAACLFDPVMAGLAGNTFIAGFESLIEAVFAAEDPGPLIAEALQSVSRVLFIFLALPPLLVAAVSETTGARSLLFQAGGMAFLTAAVPWILRGGVRVNSPAEIHIAVVLGMAGAVAGLVYWAIAGRRRAAPASVAPNPISSSRES